MDGIPLQSVVLGAPCKACRRAVLANFIQSIYNSQIRFDAVPRHIGVGLQCLVLRYTVQREHVPCRLVLGVIVDRLCICVGIRWSPQHLPLVGHFHVLAVQVHTECYGITHVGGGNGGFGVQHSQRLGGGFGCCRFRRLRFRFRLGRFGVRRFGVRSFSVRRLSVCRFGVRNFSVRSFGVRGVGGGDAAKGVYIRRVSCVHIAVCCRHCGIFRVNRKHGTCHAQVHSHCHYTGKCPIDCFSQG